MTYLIVAIVAAMVVAFVIMKKNRSGSAIDSRYICDVCGERDCICHKVDE